MESNQAAEASKPRLEREPTQGTGVNAPSIRRIDNLAEFRAHLEAVWPKRIELERAIARAHAGESAWSDPGYCEACRKDTLFESDWASSDGQMPNFREKLRCVSCELNSRQRFMAARVREFLESSPEPRALYLYEQVTPFFAYVERLARGTRSSIVGSEYLGHERKSGEHVGPLRHEDAQSLSFEDASLDLVVSNDVYEHVPDPAKCFGEARRVLKRGGQLLFTIPFYAGKQDTVRRAEIVDGKLVHLREPAYHGNPVDPQGCLVFNDFAWDLMDVIRAAGFSDVAMLAYHDARLGYLGGGIQFLFRAIR